MITKHSEEQERVVLDALHAGKTGREAARLADLSPSSVSNIVRKHGIKTKAGRPPWCKVDHTVFDTLTEESEYWLGFLFADGCVTTGYGGTPQIILCLSARDRVHVEKFKIFCKSTHKLINKKYRSKAPGAIRASIRCAATFGFRSEQVTAALRRYGMVAKKGIDRRPSLEIQDSVHFWRGCIDGDGTLGINLDKRRGYRAPYLILCGHMPIMLSYQQFLRLHDIKTNINKTSSGIYQIRIANSLALKMIRRLYGDAKVSLDRKREIANTILAMF
ncbi:MAG: hypothetical protein UY96_C0003G0107 [Parcubacteria group bacterium GW2011_GWB1_56_8]|nr:MAG: hypothetical protein UY96_C0003G0107 [Parcubacteria group bacterium GW2011_GWB1_56_8]